MLVQRNPSRLSQLPSGHCEHSFRPTGDLNVSLPASQQAIVEDQVAGGRYLSICGYLSDLIRADQKAKAQEKLEALLPEGLDSGPGSMDRHRLGKVASAGCGRLEPSN